MQVTWRGGVGVDGAGGGGQKVGGIGESCAKSI